MYLGIMTLILLVNVLVQQRGKVIIWVKASDLIKAFSYLGDHCDDNNVEFVHCLDIMAENNTSCNRKGTFALVSLRETSGLMLGK